MTSEDTTNKPFQIDKRRVYEAYKAVKSNGGAAGVDRQTIEQFEADLGGNLYKMEQDELGNLLSTAGARRLHSQKERRPADFRGAHRKRSYRADGGQTAYRAGSGSHIPARLLRLQTEEIGPGRSWSHA